jgi:hypothetical protein
MILSHAKQTFLTLDPQIGPQAFKHAYRILRKNVFLM